MVYDVFRKSSWEMTESDAPKPRETTVTKPPFDVSKSVKTMTELRPKQHGYSANFAVLYMSGLKHHGGYIVWLFCKAPPFGYLLRVQAFSPPVGPRENAPTPPKLTESGESETGPATDNLRLEGYYRINFCRALLCPGVSSRCRIKADLGGFEPPYQVCFMPEA